jgi:hypothetical protein
MKSIDVSAAKSRRSLSAIKTSRRLSSTISRSFRPSRMAQRTGTRRMRTKFARWNTKRSWWSSMIIKISERTPRKCTASFASAIFSWLGYQEIEKTFVLSIRRPRRRPATLREQAGNSTWYRTRRRCHWKILSGKLIINFHKKACTGNRRRAILSRPSCTIVSMNCAKWTSEVRSTAATEWTTTRIKTTIRRSMTGISFTTSHCITGLEAHWTAINNRMQICRLMTAIAVSVLTINLRIISGKWMMFTVECTRIFLWASYQTKDL